ncbi:Hypothetical predicted protein [Octopus vulgaris]|uniref:Uncharacterized protein n=1 Tax=Octopus vulgaris TaxID=6645 RepID=A0AA36F5V0_OCTVU|nr:Hypothetical predicted protein [Octopus vulgaris]
MFCLMKLHINFTYLMYEFHYEYYSNFIEHRSNRQLHTTAVIPAVSRYGYSYLSFHSEQLDKIQIFTEQQMWGTIQDVLTMEHKEQYAEKYFKKIILQQNLIKQQQTIILKEKNIQISLKKNRHNSPNNNSIIRSL